MLFTGLILLAISGCGGGGLTKEKYLKINEGMDVGDAKLILGSPTSDEPPKSFGDGVDFKGHMTWKSEKSEKVSVTVYYDRERKVTGKMQEGLN
jgi:hypothetical protein